MEKSVFYLKKAESLSDKIKEENLKFLSLGHLAHTYIQQGRKSKFVKNIKKIDVDLKDYLKSKDMPFLAFYYFLKGVFYYEIGQYAEAIKLMDNAISNHDSKMEFRRIEEYLRKGEIYLKLKDFDKAKFYADKVARICEDAKEIGSKLIVRNLPLQCGISIEKNNLKEAKNIIKKAKHKMEEHHLSKYVDGGKDKPKTYMIELLILEGDIDYLSKNYRDSLEKYIEAENVFLAKYEGVIELDIFSELFEKIVKVALSIKDMATADHYYRKHYEHFGVNNERTDKILKNIFEYKDD